MKVDLKKEKPMLCKAVNQATYNTTQVCLSPMFWVRSDGAIICPKCKEVWSLEDLRQAQQ